MVTINFRLKSYKIVLFLFIFSLLMGFVCFIWINNSFIRIIPFASSIAFGLPLSVSMKIDKDKGSFLKKRMGFTVVEIPIVEIVKLTGKRTSYIDSVKLNKQDDEVDYEVHLVNGESISLGSNLYVNQNQITIGEYLKRQYQIPYEEKVTNRSTNVV